METFDRIGLPEAAELLGLHRSTLNEMILRNRLPAHRDGPHWFIKREEFDRFAASYARPKNAPRRHPATARDEWTRELLRWLASWEEANVADLSRVVRLHPGNIRKYLCFLEAEGLAERDEYASWRLTAVGRKAAEVAGFDDGDETSTGVLADADART